MFPFIETLRIIDGEIKNLPYHQARLERTLQHFWPEAPVVRLEEVLEKYPRKSGIFKARVIYDGSGIVETGYAPYQVRHIRQLKLIPCDTINYSYKSTDRRALAALAAQKEEADEIIIVRNGLLTDTSYSNIALSDGEKWVTPRLPLLEGTMRQYLLESNQITAADIPATDWHLYKKVALINAMMPLGTCVVELL